MTKHTPATPLPWKSWDDDGTGTKPCVLGEKVNGFGNFYAAQSNMHGDATYIAHAANAYPKLVERLYFIAGHAEDKDTREYANDLLEELGEQRG